MKIIVTHNGTFHADEITAIALIQIFVDPMVSIDRVPHQSTINKADYDYVIDIGRQYDPTKGLFDHHQWQGGKSSAGLIWEYINDNNYPNIDTLIKAIDDNDVGIKPASPIEYSRLISLYNEQDIHSEGQEIAFYKAVSTAIDMLTGMKRNQDALNESKSVCENAPFFNDINTIIELPQYMPGWQTFINGQTMPTIEAVVYPDHKLGTWNIQTTNVATTSYDKVGRKLMPAEFMEFVHAANFFAVARTRDDMTEYVNNYME